MTVETTSLAPGYAISRMIRGGWQLAGGHGPIDREAAIAEMAAFLDAGITTIDCADIYTGVEDLIGAFRRGLAAKRGAAAARALKVHTKCVPDYDLLPRLKKADVEATIDRSLLRLGVERLDLVQFHWWNTEVPGVLDLAGWLDDMRRAGKIHLLGVTNFDTAHVAAILAHGVPLASIQTQYSPLDVRPEVGLAALCARHDMKLLCYGSLAGGFLSERWLGVDEPAEPLANRSLTKYKLIIDDFGGWALFQRLLRTLSAIASKHGVGIPAVAARWTLDRPGVGAVIVGARHAGQLADNLAMFRLSLDAADRAAIDAVLAERTGPAGDAYALERDKDGRHGRIMKYNLNRE